VTYERPDQNDNVPPGLLWTQAVVEGTRQAQAALAAGTLRQLGTPVMQALARHREMASALGDTAEQMSRIATHVADLARQHDAASAQLQASMQPYLSYIAWLDRESGQPPIA
jgi:ABC-type transporter Mla subunit MlaD